MHTKNGPTNKIDKFSVALMKEKKIVGDLIKEKSGRFFKTVYYFLDVMWKIQTVCNAVNLGDGKGKTVPCILLFTGKKNLQIL